MFTFSKLARILLLSCVTLSLTGLTACTVEEDHGRDHHYDHDDHHYDRDHYDHDHDHY